MKRFLVIVVLIVANCAKAEEKSNSESLMDYFPQKPGTAMSWKITLCEVEPLNYRAVDWPKSSGSEQYITRGRFSPVAENFYKVFRKTFFLKLKVKGPAEKQGQLHWPVGIELAVEKDELGVYEDAKQVFLAIDNRSKFVCREVVTYSPEVLEFLTEGDWGRHGKIGNVGHGSAMRTLFFAGKPGEEKGIGKDPQDKLAFKGEELVPGLYVKGLHFVRTVAELKGKKNFADEFLGRGFVEHTYFVKGKGLVYLEQKIGGKTSMLWVRAE